MTRVHLMILGMLGSLWACDVTNTGNPAQPGSAPEGIALVRSRLQRDPAPRVSQSESEQFAQGERAFAFDMYEQIKTGDENLFFSPYSIQVALAMTYAGARGETKTEMASALHFDLPEPALHAAFNGTDLALQARATEQTSGGKKGDGFELHITNAAFAPKDFGFVPAYLDVLAQNYAAGTFHADFAAHPERERMAINRWVEMQTHDRIRELLPTGSITPLTVLVLANAIYFKASWADAFDAAMTATASFHAPNGAIDVPMMHGSAHQYAQGDGYQALELAYVTPSVRMLFILPDEGRFADIEARLGADYFDQIRAALSEHYVDVKLPRFSFDAEFELPEALNALGMVRAFGADADLSGIAGPPGDLRITGVYHKAFVALDEQGTEAAAATGVVVGVKSIPPRASFFADRPFIFAIYDAPTGQILFAGRLMNPH